MFYDPCLDGPSCSTLRPLPSHTQTLDAREFRVVGGLKAWLDCLAGDHHPLSENTSHSPTAAAPKRRALLKKLDVRSTRMHGAIMCMHKAEPASSWALLSYELYEETTPQSSAER